MTAEEVEYLLEPLMELGNDRDAWVNLRLISVSRKFPRTKRGGDFGNLRITKTGEKYEALDLGSDEWAHFRDNVCKKRGIGWTHGGWLDWNNCEWWLCPRAE